MNLRWIVVPACLLASIVAPPSSPLAEGQAKPKVVLFSQQMAATAAFEMAQKQGYFAEEGVDVDFRYFPSGVTAFQAFRAGQGDIVYSGEIPGIRIWAEAGQTYRVIAAVERSAKYSGLVAKSSIKQISDLKGKKIAQRVGSVSSHFVYAILRKGGLTEKDVTILDMDGPAMVSALDRGDIDAFALWSPYVERALEVSGPKVHVLTYADAVVAGYYTIISAREEWIEKNRPALTRFMKAAVRGNDYVRQNKAAVVAHYHERFGLETAQVSRHYDVLEYMMRFDERFYTDVKQFGGWMREVGMLKDPLSFDKLISVDGLRAVNPALAPTPR